MGIVKIAIAKTRIVVGEGTLSAVKTGATVQWPSVGETILAVTGVAEIESVDLWCASSRLDKSSAESIASHSDLSRDERTASRSDLSRDESIASHSDLSRDERIIASRSDLSSAERTASRSDLSVRREIIASRTPLVSSGR